MSPKPKVAVTSARPKLVVLPGGPALDVKQLAALVSTFDLEMPDDPAEAQRILQSNPGTMVLGSQGACQTASAAGMGGENLMQTPGSSALQAIGDGIGVVNARRELLWANQRLAQHDPATLQQFTSLCASALQRINESSSNDPKPALAGLHRFSIQAGDRALELTVAPVRSAGQAGGPVDAVVGVLWDVTAARALQARIEAIEAAGAELVKLDSAAVTHMHAAERLRMIEEKIIRAVHEHLQVDTFEIRVINRKTGQLELVTAVGIAPLKIGESIFAKPDGNGISGYVAVTGRSYLCPDVRKDPMYREGLESAASSLTVPLRLHDRVTGVLNLESRELNHFTDNDRLLAELLARHIALALNTLDLLVAERFTTNEQVAGNMLGEIREPLDEIAKDAEGLLAEQEVAGSVRAAIARIVAGTSALRSRVERCSTGPRNILDVEHELHRQQRDPALVGRRLLIADDEPAIRDTIGLILRQKGCDVTICCDGSSTMAALEATQASHQPFDLVLSDIRMPDRNGYEVFRFAKSISADTAVILMTGFGYDPHHCIVRSSQEGLHSFLFKPFKASQLVEEVTKALKARAQA